MVKDKLGEGSALPVIRVREQAHPLLLLYHTIANSLKTESIAAQQHTQVQNTSANHQIHWGWGLFSPGQIRRKEYRKNVNL
jgi:hypothetical protein